MGLAVPAVQAAKVRLPKVVPGFWECVMNADPQNTGVMLRLEGGTSFGAHRGNAWVQASLDPQLDSLSPARVTRKLDDQGNVTFWCVRCGAQLRYRSAPDGRPIEVEACVSYARAHVASAGEGKGEAVSESATASGPARRVEPDRSSTGAATSKTVKDTSLTRATGSDAAAVSAPTPPGPPALTNPPSAQEAAESRASRAKLDALRVELYKALADHREIGRVCQEVVNHYSGTIASVNEITKRN